MGTPSKRVVEKKLSHRYWSMAYLDCERSYRRAREKEEEGEEEEGKEEEEEEEEVEEVKEEGGGAAGGGGGGASTSVACLLSTTPLPSLMDASHNENVPRSPNTTRASPRSYTGGTGSSGGRSSSPQALINSSTTEQAFSLDSLCSHFSASTCPPVATDSQQLSPSETSLPFGKQPSTSRCPPLAVAA